MRLFRTSNLFARRERGTTLIETAVALAILGAIAVTFLSGLATTTKAVGLTDEQTTAESLAQSQMEWVKNASYSYNATGYSPASIPGGKDYINYSAIIAAESLHDPDDGIQKITVTVKRSDKEVIKLEGYKVDR
jgi:type II secretory pathway pseudopilin PulG